MTCHSPGEENPSVPGAAAMFSGTLRVETMNTPVSSDCAPAPFSACSEM